MLAVLQITFAALLTGVTAWSMGMLLFRSLGLSFFRSEEIPYAFVTGSALLSTGVFLLATLHLAYVWAFGILAAIAMAACARRGAYRLSNERLLPLPRFWLWVFILCFAAYGSLYLMNALAPEISPDGSAYHLGLVAKYLRQHAFGRVTTNMYANLSMGIEMLFLFAFAFGRHSAAATAHFLFYLALPLTMVAFARRKGIAVAGVIAALLVMLSPVVGADGSSAYIDVGTAAVVFTLFCLLQIWDEDRRPALLVPIGLLAGFAYACKLTAFAAVPYTLVFVGWKLLRMRQRVSRPLALVALCIAATMGPWLIKNAVVVGNPFSPFLNRFFPNPNVRISFEQDYLERHRTYEGIKSAWQVPMEAAVRGGLLQGLLGPVFLLLPVGLLALRWSLGRQCLLAGFIFSLSYLGNAGTRFLLLGLPFLSLALAMALASWRGMGAAAVMFHALFSWPDTTAWYCDPYAWRIDHFLYKPAFRIQKEHDFLAQRSGGYLAAKLVEQKTPRDAKLFTFGSVTEAYCRREVLVAYEAAFNNTLGDIVATGMIRDYQPVRAWSFHIPEQPLLGVRIVQTREGMKGENWTVAEVHISSSSGELPKDGQWRLRAKPNPWDVQMMFDGCPITRWNSSERARPGMLVEVEFGRPVRVSDVRVDLSPLQPTVSARLEGETQSGRWAPLTDRVQVSELSPPASSRKMAMDDLKRLGITHVCISDGDFVAEDMFRNFDSWGLTMLGEAGGNKLYRID